MSIKHRFSRRLQVPLEGWLSAAQYGYWVLWENRRYSQLLSHLSSTSKGTQNQVDTQSFKNESVSKSFNRGVAVKDKKAKIRLRMG